MKKAEGRCLIAFGEGDGFGSKRVRALGMPQQRGGKLLINGR